MAVRIKPNTRPRILVIEDDQDTGTLLIDTLSEEGFEVRSETDGLQGLAVATEWKPDLILLDVMMPKVNGIEICRRIRKSELGSSLPILFITAKDGLSDKIEGFRAGGNDYITKPFLIGELLARIEAHLRLQTLRRDLAFSEERYRLLVENSPDGLLLLTPDFEVRFFNSRFPEILNLPATAELIGKTLNELAHYSEIFPKIAILAAQVNNTHQKETKEFQIATPDHQTRFLAVFGLPLNVRESQLEMVQIGVQDVSQRRHMEDALIQAEKIHSLGILTAGIAHEVNNPLTGISNAIQILQRCSVGPQRQQELCDLVLTHIARIANIVKDLRTFSRPHNSVPEVFPLQETIVETLSLARYQASPEKITIEFQHPPEPLFLYGDRNQFQQVMINLLVNSIQAISERGSIFVSLAQDGGNARITLEDTGCGIPPGQLGLIFDPFFTTKRHWKGTGLGLAVSYRIIQLFKGTLTVDSTVNKGSRFVIALPLSRIPAQDGLPLRGSRVP